MASPPRAVFVGYFSLFLFSINDIVKNKTEKIDLLLSNPLCDRFEWKKRRGKLAEVEAKGKRKAEVEFWKVRIFSRNTLSLRLQRVTW